MSHLHHVCSFWYLTRITICSCSSSTSTVPYPPLTLNQSPVCRYIVALHSRLPRHTKLIRHNRLCDNITPTNCLCFKPAKGGQRRQRGARCMRVSLA